MNDFIAVTILGISYIHALVVSCGLMSDQTVCGLDFNPNVDITFDRNSVGITCPTCTRHYYHEEE